MCISKIRKLCLRSFVKNSIFFLKTSKSSENIYMDFEKSINSFKIKKNDMLADDYLFDNFVTIC